MAIEVLLRRSIEGVGRVGEVVRVRNGYARNYLLPRGFAAMVSAEAMRHVEKDKAAEAVREAQLAKERAALADRLAAVTLTIEARAGEDGHLYGSVGTRQVLDALKKQKYEFEERHVKFDPVRELGEYEVRVQLARDHVVPVKLWVVQDAEEAVAQAEAKAASAARGEAPAAGTKPAESRSSEARSSEARSEEGGAAAEAKPKKAKEPASAKAAKAAEADAGKAKDAAEEKPAKAGKSRKEAVSSAAAPEKAEAGSKPSRKKGS